MENRHSNFLHIFFVGGHPYLTGLAIAGGVIFIGLEGAFVGPFVLCSLVASFDIYNRILTNTTSVEQSSYQKREHPISQGLRYSKIHIN